jgi:hypothetical protein
MVGERPSKQIAEFGRLDYDCPGGHQIRDQSSVARSVFAQHYHGLLNARVLPQRRLDFPKFDAKAP